MHDGHVRMPNGSNSSALFFVSAATAMFRMLPTAFPVCRAASPLTLTIRPHPWTHMPATTSRAQRMYPMTLVSISAWKNSPVISVIFGGPAKPAGSAAAFTRMSMLPPRRATAWATD